MKPYIVLAIVLVLLGIVLQDNYQQRKEVASLRDSITSYNKAQAKSVKTITKIREVYKNVKEPCDCYNQPLPDDVIKFLHKQ